MFPGRADLCFFFIICNRLNGAGTDFPVPAVNVLLNRLYPEAQSDGEQGDAPADFREQSEPFAQGIPRAHEPGQMNAVPYRLQPFVQNKPFRIAGHGAGPVLRPAGHKAAVNIPGFGPGVDVCGKPQARGQVFMPEMYHLLGAGSRLFRIGNRITGVYSG